MGPPRGCRVRPLCVGEGAHAVAELDHVAAGVGDVDADAELVVHFQHGMAVAAPAVAVAGEQVEADHLGVEAVRDGSVVSGKRNVVESQGRIVAPRRKPAGTEVQTVAMFLGKDLIVWLLLALGGALFAGNLMAVIRPPTAPKQDGDLTQAPRARSLTMAAIGFVVAMAALAALVTR